MFWVAVGVIRPRNLNWCKTDEKVRFHPSRRSPSLAVSFVVISWS